MAHLQRPASYGLFKETVKQKCIFEDFTLKSLPFLLLYSIQEFLMIHLKHGGVYTNKSNEIS